MKLRALYRRARRRPQGNLKLGRAAIRDLSDEQFDALLVRIRRAAGTQKGSANVRAIKRLAKKLRRDGDVSRRSLVIRQGFRSDPVLDTIYPERQKEWLFSWRRTNVGEFDLERFSFIDDPLGTIRSLREIVEREATYKSYRLNFRDRVCLDVSSYMVLGLLREKMLPVITGGKITDGIRRVINAADLAEFLNIERRRLKAEALVAPFPLRQRRATGGSVDDNLGTSPTSEERTASALIATINRWLLGLTPPAELNEHGRANVLTLTGETLDNAKRHSDPGSADGTWAIAGFMEERQRDDRSRTLACHIGIMNPGETIHQSLQRAPVEIRAAIQRYVDRHRPGLFHRPRYDEEALWTLCALQDGISRVPRSDRGAKGGVGMMMIVEMMNALNRSDHPSDRPQMTIVSGTSCIMVRDGFRVFTKDANGRRVLWFNPENSFEKPPDDTYVFSLPYRLQGTIVALRFFLDPSERKNGAPE